MTTIDLDAGRRTYHLRGAPVEELVLDLYTLIVGIKAGGKETLEAVAANICGLGLAQPEIFVTTWQLTDTVAPTSELDDYCAAVGRELRVSLGLYADAPSSAIDEEARARPADFEAALVHAIRIVGESPEFQ